MDYLDFLQNGFSQIFRKPNRKDNKKLVERIFGEEGIQLPKLKKGDIVFARMNKKNVFAVVVGRRKGYYVLLSIDLDYRGYFYTGCLRRTIADFHLTRRRIKNLDEIFYGEPHKPIIRELIKQQQWRT